MSDVVPFPHEGWSAEDAERFLLARERFGMRFGLDRIHRLLNVLELGQIPFPSIEIVGTNGKSSTTRMLAAVLERHGLRTGCFTSPHLLSYRERIRVGEQDIVPERFAAQIARTVRAGELVDRSQQDAADRVTQFELLTAAALAEFAAAGVDVAVLTNVGLEHTRYLGPTIADIAREKLAVVRPGATLVIGAGLAQSARELAWRTAAERGVKLVRAVEDRRIAPELAARGAYQRRNFAAACTAARAFLGRELDREAVLDAAHSVTVPGRFEVHDGAPQVLFDGAHNPGGIDALTASLPEFVVGRRLVAVVSILDDKDAASMLRGLLAHIDALVCTATASPRALPAATLASLAGQLGAGEVLVEPRPHEAMNRAREIAGAPGVVLATGSIYLLAELLRDPEFSAPVSTI